MIYGFSSGLSTVYFKKILNNFEVTPITVIFTQSLMCIIVCSILSAYKQFHPKSLEKLKTYNLEVPTFDALLKEKKVKTGLFIGAFNLSFSLVGCFAIKMVPIPL